MSAIARSLAQVRERIAEACLRAGRSPHDVTLVAVSKTFPAPVVLEAVAAGQRDFGENRVEEALTKIEQIGEPTGEPTDAIRWHLIGHVQSRKARLAAGRFHLIHSVDSLKLATRLNSACQLASVRQSLLLECNVSGEASKDGFPLAGWEHDPPILEAFVRDVAGILALPHVQVVGLMTMAPIVEDPDRARPVFASLRALRSALNERLPTAGLRHLSMGMTDDFEAAIAEGATIVRIGRAIFGSRA